MAFGAMIREFVWFRMFGPLFQIDTSDLWYHVARALQSHNIAFANILADDFVFVMKRRPADHHTADRHWLQLSDRRQCASAADLNDNFVQFGFGLFWREFMRNRPPWRAANKAKSFLPVKPIDFINHAVDIIGKCVPLRFHLMIIG